VSTTAILWWAIGTFGLGGVILGALIFLGFGPTILAFFTQTKIGRALAFVGGLILTGLVIFFKGRAAGKAEQIEVAKKQTAKEVERAEKNSKRIDALPDDKVDEELGKWDRKG